MKLLAVLAAASCAVPERPAAAEDVRVRSSRMPLLARALAPVSMTLKLEAVGGGPRSLTVSTTVGPLETVEYVTLSGPGEHAVQVPVRLPEPGDYPVRVRVSGAGPDADSGNDSVAGWIRARPEKPRILYVEESPRYEYRYLKTALVKDATVHVQAFLASAQPEFPAGALRVAHGSGVRTSPGGPAREVGGTAEVRRDPPGRRRSGPFS